jgi:pyruvate dehydrogenase E2 component (dihydrolipoamide acetyltransferase)
MIASPRARRAMRERGVDPAFLHGSGPGGRIVEADVLKAETFGQASAGSGDPRRAQPVNASFHFWLQATADVTSLLDVQGQAAEEVQRACGTPLRLADLLLRAMALALADCPQANCVWQDGTRVDLKTVDVGFEVETPGGRVAPVIRQADRLRLMELVSRRAELTAAARAGRLPPEAAQPAATSLCDLTEHPVDQYAAILLPPQASVLAAGRPALRPAAFENRLCLRQTLCVCLTADQRAIAPEIAAALLGRIVELIEHPFLLLCERLPR